DHMRAEELAAVGIEDGLHQALVFAERDGLAVADKGKAADFDGAALLLGSLFGQPHAGDLRLAVGAAGNLRLVEGMWLQALDGFHAHHPLTLRLVRKHRRSGYIADGVDTRHAGAAVAVGGDGRAVRFDAELLEPEVLDIADHAYGTDHALGAKTLGRALAVVDAG